MAQLIIFREKSMMGMAAPMNCYVNGVVVCKVKNGETVSCEVDNAVVGFKCNILSNPMSNEVYLDLNDGKTVSIKIKQGVSKPAVTIDDESAITTQPPSTVGIASSSPIANSKGDIRTALRDLQRSTDITGSKNSIVVTDAGLFAPTQEVGNYFAVDENSRLFAVCKGKFPSYKNVVYNYDDIVDFELIEDDSSIIKGGIGSAVVGGVLFGGVGAIVGGSTGKRKVKQTCTNLMIKITVNNMSAPVEYIKLITTTVRKDSIIYRGAYQDAQEIISLLQLICNQRNNVVNTSQEPTQKISSADEIRRYKELMEDGIITEEEFQAKKKQLLGI